jgi:hypothetical protein
VGNGPNRADELALVGLTASRLIPAAPISCQSGVSPRPRARRHHRTPPPMAFPGPRGVDQPGESGSVRRLGGPGPVQGGSTLCVRDSSAGSGYELLPSAGKWEGVGRCQIRGVSEE